MDYNVALRINALHNVIKDDNVAYTLRSIFRWYSKTFHTPLHIVETLPLDDVLINYYEEKYEGLAEPRLNEEISLLLETDEQKKERLQKEDSERVVENSLLENAQNMFSKPTKNKIDGLGAITDTLTRLAKKTDKILENSQEEKGILNPLPQNVSISFLGEDDSLDLEEDTFGMTKDLK